MSEDQVKGIKPVKNTLVFSKSSEEHLKDVHPDLVKLARRALELSNVDFGIADGVRTPWEQRELLSARATQTLNSRHVPMDTMAGGNGKGHALDVFPVVNKKVRYDGRLFAEIKNAWTEAGRELKIKFNWGGDWKDFHDAPHFELDWEEYPADKPLE